jgi:hypothetical protein
VPIRKRNKSLLISAYSIRSRPSAPKLHVSARRVVFCESLSRTLTMTFTQNSLLRKHPVLFFFVWERPWPLGPCSKPSWASNMAKFLAFVPIAVSLPLWKQECSHRIRIDDLLEAILTICFARMFDNIINRRYSQEHQISIILRITINWIHITFGFFSFFVFLTSIVY